MTYRSYIMRQVDIDFGLINLTRKHISEISINEHLEGTQKSRIIDELYYRIESLTREVDSLLKYREALKEDGFIEYEVSEAIKGNLSVD